MAQRQRQPIGPGRQLAYRGELVEIVEIRTDSGGNVATVKTVGNQQVRLITLRDLLRYRDEHPHEECCEDSPEDAAATVLAMVDEAERRNIRERASHVREVLTGYRSGSPELTDGNEPKPQYDPARSLTTRYAAKATELGVNVRTVQRMVASFREHGEAALASGNGVRAQSLPSVDDRWREMAVEVMVEHTGESRPSRTAVIRRVNARIFARYGPGMVQLPSRATAFRLLAELESKYPVFRMSTKRNRDVAERNPGVYGKLRPTRPGEYMLMDTSRLDVFAMDPTTLRWCQVELTVAMDWYTRCITGLRVTPVSTKSSDVAAVLFQAYCPPAASPSWPPEACWPEHGIPRTVLLDRDAMDREAAATVGPAIIPETLVIDHGKVFVSEHLTSVCERLGISIQPARLRTGRDKGPVERFFRTLREDLLQYLPAYKGPDIHSRGSDPEAEAHFYLDELEAILREWVAVIYHRRPHSGLVEAGLPGLDLAPATMFEHGLARAGYLEVPHDPDLAYEFLGVEKRTIQHYGVEIRGRIYNGTALDPYRNERSPYSSGQWPLHYHPDDISRVYFRDPVDRTWHTLMWDHAAALDQPFSEDALKFARRLARQMFKYPNDELAMEILLERWNLGLGRTPAERRMALRLSRQDELLSAAGLDERERIATLPAVQRALVDPKTNDGDESEPTESKAVEGDDEIGEEAEDFYADAWEDA